MQGTPVRGVTFGDIQAPPHPRGRTWTDQGTSLAFLAAPGVAARRGAHSLQPPYSNYYLSDRLVEHKRDPHVRPLLEPADSVRVVERRQQLELSKRCRREPRLPRDPELLLEARPDHPWTKAGGDARNAW